MKLKTYQTLFWALFSVQAFGQTPFTASETIDINNIKAPILVHGDMWWNPATAERSIEYPKTSGHRAGGPSGIWMSAYDQQSQLYTSTTLYRQDGVDYWPGPLSSSTPLDYATSAQWAKVWKVNRADIENFKKLASRTTANVPAQILEWPARGNANAKGANGINLTINTDMAPYVDVNHDQKYNALDGDYPDIHGDQMLWWVMNDEGPAHSTMKSIGQGLRTEIHACAYAYANGTNLDNIVFYEYEVTNKSALDYKDFRFSIFSDGDLGYFNDDYIGFDSTLRMGIEYNAAPDDGATIATSDVYRTMIPIMGVTLIETPGDKNKTFVPAGSFMYYNNDFSSFGNPSDGLQCSYYMRSQFRNGQHLRNDFVGPNLPAYGGGAGPDANYAFPGDVADKTQWSECNSVNTTGDRRFIVTTAGYDFNKGTTTKIAWALVFTPPALNLGCSGNLTFTGIKSVGKLAWDTYYSQSSLGVNEIRNKTNLKVYPNPAQSELFLKGDNLNNTSEAIIINSLGQKLDAQKLNPVNGTYKMDISALAPGIYYLVLNNDGNIITECFSKQ